MQQAQLMTPVALYARVSSDRQDVDLSVALGPSLPAGGGVSGDGLPCFVTDHGVECRCSIEYEAAYIMFSGQPDQSVLARGALPTTVSDEGRRKCDRPQDGLAAAQS